MAVAPNNPNTPYNHMGEVSGPKNAQAPAVHDIVNASKLSMRRI
jgi:hypothetical protein